MFSGIRVLSCGLLSLIRQLRLLEYFSDIDIDESYFGGVRKGKRIRGVVGKVVAFGMLKRHGKVYTVIVENTKEATLMPVIANKIKIDSIVYIEKVYMNCEGPHKSIWQSKETKEACLHLHKPPTFQDPRKELEYLRTEIAYLRDAHSERISQGWVQKKDLQPTQSLRSKATK